MTMNRRASLRKSAILACLLSAIGCKDQTPEHRVGSETNFLLHCSTKCDTGLTCLCGVCTRACTGTNECSSLSSDATCVPIVYSPTSEAAASCNVGATCELSCVANRDCDTLGSEYRCETGFCRKGDLQCPAQSLATGDEERDLVVDGVTRTYSLHVPQSYAGTSPVPLVLDFHPMTLGATWEKDNSGYGPLADQEGFVVVWPHGMNGTWDLGPCCTTSSPADDFAFARAIVRQLSTQACIDPARVYAVGFSLGGSMAYYLGCQQAEVFAAVAVSSMDLFVDSQLSCEPSRPITEISFRGSADTVVPYAGGVSSPPGSPDLTTELLGAVGTFEKWATINQCQGDPSDADANGCSTYSACQSGAEVTLCTVLDGAQVVGDASIAWDTLKRHPMP